MSYVQVVFNDEPLYELPYVQPSAELLEQYQDFLSLEKKASTLIKLNRSTIIGDSNKIVLPKQLIEPKKRKGRPPKVQVEVESVDDMEEEDEEVLDDLDLENLDIELEDDLEEENQVSVSSDNRKLTKRQLSSIRQAQSSRNMDSEQQQQLLQLPDKKGKNKKKVVLTEEDIAKRNAKEIERKQKLQRQQEEFKQQTVDRILNEVGKKQKQRQEQEEKESQKKVHQYKSLPPGDLVIKYKADSNGIGVHIPYQVDTHDLYALPTSFPIIKERPNCTNCHSRSKYTLPHSTKYACSLACYKILAN